MSRTARPSGNARLGTWARVALGLVLAGAVTRWPYAHACGLSLVGYLAAVAVVLVAAAWADAHAWQNRMVRAHLASLVLLAWGLALGAGQVLPRVGYASQSASWVCSVPAPRTSSTPVSPVPAPETTPGEGGEPAPASNRS